MEIVDFSDKVFNEIPMHEGPLHERRECVLVCLSEKKEANSKAAIFTVIHVIPDKDSQYESTEYWKGMFWEKEDALTFAEAITKKQNIKTAVKSKRPPTGTPPSFLYIDDRLEELKTAVNRYMTEEQGIPQKWIEEYHLLLQIRKL
jgi:hypothetical protein